MQDLVVQLLIGHQQNIAHQKPGLKIYQQVFRLVQMKAGILLTATFVQYVLFKTVLSAIQVKPHF